MDSEHFPDREHWKKIGDRYLDVARTSATRTSAIAFLWMIAVIISVVSFADEADKGKAAIIKTERAYLKAMSDLENAICDFFKEPGLDKKCREMVDIDSSKKKLKDRFLYISNDFEKTRCQSEKMKRNEERDAEFLILCAYEKVNTAEENFREALSSTTKLQLPTFPSFNIKLVYVPTLLNLIVLSLAIYLSIMRVRTFTYLSRALHIMKQYIGKSKNEMSDILSPRNWWLTPLPLKSRTLVSDEEFALALGWSHSSQAKPILALFFWLSILFIQFYLTFIISIPKDIFLPGVNEVPVNFISFLNVLPLGITFSIFLWWFVPGTVPDGNFDPDNEIRKERRRFLTHLGIGTILSLIIINKPSSLKNPRFRKKKSPLFWGLNRLNGLLLYPVSKPPIRMPVYIAKKGYLMGMRQSQLPNRFRPTLLEPFNPHELIDSIGIYINRSIVSISYESAAKELFNKNQTEDTKKALEILLEGMKQDLKFKQRANLVRGINETRGKPRKKKRVASKTVAKFQGRNENEIVTIRLYDLFAREAVRNNLSELIHQQLIPFINHNKLTSIFVHRISKWTNQDSKWYRKLVKYGLRSSNVG